MGVEIVAYVWKHSTGYFVHAHGLIVEHGPRDGKDDKDSVKEEERGHDDERALVELLVAGEEIIECHGGYHRIIRSIAEIHQFGENGM